MSSDGSESDTSDIKIQSALLKTSNKKMPSSPTHYLLKKQQDKKLTTKIMIIQALVDLKSRKGVSLYAIKKYITAKYSVDAVKLNYHIKKFLKSAVEKGTVVQTKGVGATGSFKLVPVKEKKPKTKKTKKEKTEKDKDPEKKKTVKEKSKKTDGKTSKSNATEGKKIKSKVKPEGSKENKPVKAKKKMDVEKMPKEKKDDVEKVKKVRIAKKNMQTPSKKKGMMKRKSIGSIIKQPKMKPSAKA